MEQIRIHSYFSLSTDLAEEMRDWPEFVDGQGYSVDLRDTAIENVIFVRYVEAGEDSYVTVEAAQIRRAFRQSRVICVLSMNSDNVLVSTHGRKA